METYKKIINPITGRKVNITSKLGIKIIKNYLNQLGGAKNPHTGKEWSSYKCKGLSEDHCENMENYKRCTWVEATNKKKAHCKKTERASRKRGKKNWKAAKSAIKKRVKLDLSSLRLSTEDAEELLHERDIDPKSKEGQTLITELVALEYDPNYKSAFGTGKPINKFTVQEPQDVLWWQAADKLDANTKYGDNITNDDIGYGWLEDDDEDDGGYESFKNKMKDAEEEEMDRINMREKAEADYLDQVDPSDINPAFEGMTKEELQSEYENYMEDKRERNEIYHGF